MSVQLFTQQLKEARRDALVSSYIANKLPEDLRDKVKTADDLYEYLLLDTKISEQVKTSPLAESISSLQLAIHRALEGYDGPLDDEAKQYLANEQFLFNWSDYNSRYSTWAGKERLRFYAANYVEPSLRIEKTLEFKKFEGAINQGKLNADGVSSALDSYLSEYDVISSLKYISVCCKDDDDSQLAFLALSNSAEKKLYRRYCEIKNGLGVFSEAELVNHGFNLDCASEVTPFWYAGCLYISAIVVKNQNDSNGKEILTPYIKLMKIDNPTYTYREIELSEQKFYGNIISLRGGLYLKTNEGSYYELINDNTEISKEEIKPVLNFKNHTDNGTDFKVYHDSYYVTGSINTITSDISVSVHSGYTSTITLDGSVYEIKQSDGNVVLGEKPTVNSVLNVKLRYFLPDPEGHQGEGTVESIDYEIYFNNVSLPSFMGEVVSYGNGQQYINELLRIGLTPASINGEIHSIFKKNVSQLYNYDTQLKYSSPISEFFGICGMYLWEIFFHIPFLVATRFAAEQRFEEADRWYKYIFNSAGYRDEDGNLLLGNDGNPRYWNTFPLQEDTTWDESLPATTDPDVIATADPMHYKLALFQHTLDLLLARGDAAYRQLERDTLTEAKMYYIEAQQLLGPRPDIRITNTWPSPAPTLSSEAGQIATPSSLTFADWLRAGDAEVVGDGDFRPPYNDVLLDYWDKLDIRLYNLRHNLSLDGQPLSLPLYATPVDPAELHRLQAGGDGTGSNGIQGVAQVQGWRYPLLAERARSAVGMLTQFGNSLQVALERQDNEKMTLLLQTQQQTILTQQRALQQSNLDALQHNLTALQASRQGASLRHNHYTRLITQRYLPGESTALALRSSARITSLASSSLFTAAGFANMAPNTFGLATGGAQWGAALEASGRIMQIAATAEEQSAGISEVTANYQRRQEEWQLQRDMADNEIQQLDAQIEGLKEQITMAQKQISLAETEQAHAQAVYDMQTSRFTGQMLYNWLAGRLSALYYQLYDMTLPVCLQAKAALAQELGNSPDRVFRTPVWDDLWQGLLAGEALSVELQKLDNIWLSLAAKGLEATRTVSLAGQRDESSLSDTIATLLKDGKESKVNGVSLKLNDNDGIFSFSAELDLSTLGLEGSYNMQERARFIKSIAVTLPTLLGPYQDIEATLTLGGEVATLSHGMNDNGRFVTNFDDSRFLPFEGADPTTGKLSLNIFNVKAEDEPSTQYGVVENLSDIIVHIHYILRDNA